MRKRTGSWICLNVGYVTKFPVTLSTVTVVERVAILFAVVASQNGVKKLVALVETYLVPPAEENGGQQGTFFDKQFSKDIMKPIKSVVLMTLVPNKIGWLIFKRKCMKTTVYIVFGSHQPSILTRCAIGPALF